MENENFIERIATPLQQKATIKNVFGDPVQADGKTIIPVAQMAYGSGGGFGRGKQAGAASPDTNKGDRPGGAGGGGGMRAKPLGVYEISGTGTRFVPVSNTRQLLLGALIGFVIRGLFFGGKR